MTYEVFAPRSRRNINIFFDSLDDQIRKEVFSRLENNPFPSINGNDLDCIKKIPRTDFYRYYTSGGDRIIYEIVKKTNQVLIQYAGDHNGYLRFLKYCKRKGR